ncbi:hypothetical protein D3C86_1259680 [compost metagenome]
MINQALGNQQTIDFITEQMDLQQNTNGPKAALNYLFFDNSFQLIPTISGKLGITPTPGLFNNISVSPTPMTEPGYVVVFVDNNSIGTDVWFDNVQVSHYNGEVLEEDHYYPFGLTLSESNNNPALPNQPFKYNGKELEKSFGLETYEYGARQYDPQIGRWKGIDPLADKYFGISPFAYVANNPVKYVDPDGRRILIFNVTFNERNETVIEKAIYNKGKLTNMDGSSYTNNSEYIKSTAKYYDNLRKKDGRYEKVISDLENHKNSKGEDEDHIITNVIPRVDFMKNGELRSNLRTLGSLRKPGETPTSPGIIRFVPEYDLKTFSGLIKTNTTPEDILIHETKHEWNFTVVQTGEQSHQTVASENPNEQINCEEVDATNFENINRDADGRELRTSHGPNQNIPKSNQIAPDDYKL